MHLINGVMDLVSYQRRGGGFYKTERGAFRNHPCTIWAQTNFYWLIEHGLALCSEYTYRYNKVHTCQYTIEYADMTFPSCLINIICICRGLMSLSMIIVLIPLPSTKDISMLSYGSRTTILENQRENLIG